MAMCAGIATVTLTLGAIGSLPGAARRLGAVEIPIPVRPIAAILVMASVVVAPMRPRPAAATVAPPIVRLAEAAEVDREAQPSPSRAPSPTPVPPGRTATVHIVEPGDCLWRIARDVLDIAAFWPAIYETNRAVIGHNPNLSHPGQPLEIPEI